MNRPPKRKDGRRVFLFLPAEFVIVSVYRTAGEPPQPNHYQLHALLYAGERRPTFSPYIFLFERDKNIFSSRLPPLIFGNI